ncbi:MAG: GNAT family N-acetyltransferase [Actinocatenispora sp.]
MNPVPTAEARLDFRTDPAEFLAATGGYLAEQPVLNTVVATVADRAVAQRAEGHTAPERDWWLTVRDGTGAVVGAGMRTAPFMPHPAFLLPMPDEAAVALARAVHERGEELLGVNGALPTIRVFADELVRLAGGRVEVVAHTRQHELGELTPRAQVPGRLVTAVEDDLDLVVEWSAAFDGDADEQAGRPRGSGIHEMPDREVLLDKIHHGRIWFWVTEDGTKVHLVAANPPAYGVARIGPVYTPPAERGRGWASAAVAEVSRLILAEGARACLYTDQANPTSNKIYAALGYRPVVDMANLAIVR